MIQLQYKPESRCRRPTRVCSLSHVQLFVTSWSAAHQAPLFMEFSRQEYWGGFPFPTPRNLPNPGIKQCLGQRETDCLPLHHLGKLRRPMKTNDSAQKPSGKEKEFFLIQPFILFSAPLTDWMRSTHTGEGKFLAQLSNSNFNLIQKHPHRHTQK